jgi:hypothetical protein
MADGKLTFDPIPVPTPGTPAPRFPSTPLPPLSADPPAPSGLPALPKSLPALPPLPAVGVEPRRPPESKPLEPKLPEPVKVEDLKPVKPPELVKLEEPKPPAAPPPTPAPVPSKTAWVSEVLRLAVTPTKHKAVIAAGLASLIGGAAAAKLLWPAPNPTLQPVVDSTQAPLPASPVKVSPAETENKVPEVPRVELELPAATALGTRLATTPTASGPVPPTELTIPQPAAVPSAGVVSPVARLPLVPAEPAETWPPREPSGPFQALDFDAMLMLKPPPPGEWVQGLLRQRRSVLVEIAPTLPDQAVVQVRGVVPATPTLVFPPPTNPPAAAPVVAPNLFGGEPPTVKAEPPGPLPFPVPVVGTEPRRAQPELKVDPSLVLPDPTMPAVVAPTGGVHFIGPPAPPKAIDNLPPPGFPITGVGGAGINPPAVEVPKLNFGPPLPAVSGDDKTPKARAGEAARPAGDDFSTPDSGKSARGEKSGETVLPSLAGSPPAPLPLVKPAGDSTARPASAVESRTDYDVDLHEVRQGDTFSTISQKYLGDSRYAAAIEAFNGNHTIGQFGAEKVKVPPIHILRKRYAAYIDKPETTDRGTTTAPGGTEWQPASRTEPAATGTKTYTIPPGGATMRGVAKAAFGDDQQWAKVWDLNPKYRPDEVLPEGTKLLLPSDAKAGK